MSGAHVSRGVNQGQKEGEQSALSLVPCINRVSVPLPG